MLLKNTGAEALTKKLSGIVKLITSVYHRNPDEKLIDVFIEYILLAGRVPLKVILYFFRKYSTLEMRGRVMTTMEKLMLKSKREGKKEGRREGKREILRATINFIIKNKFGLIPPNLQNKITETNNIRVLEKLFKAVYNAESLDDIEDILL